VFYSCKLALLNQPTEARNEMTKSDLNEMIDQMVLEVVAGTMIKNIKRGLERLTSNSDLIEKLVRIIEIRSQELGA
jgi:hypothetical protein